MEEDLIGHQEKKFLTSECGLAVVQFARKVVDSPPPLEIFKQENDKYLLEKP